jgi:hypothetical protein
MLRARARAPRLMRHIVDAEYLGQLDQHGQPGRQPGAALNPLVRASLVGVIAALGFTSAGAQELPDFRLRWIANCPVLD